MAKSGTDVMKAPSDKMTPQNDKQMKRNQLLEIKEVSDILEAFGGEILEIREVVPDFALVEDKADLIGVPFVIAHFSENFSDDYMTHNENINEMQPSKFVSVYCLVEADHGTFKKGDKIVFNDGSTGVMATLVAFANEYNRYGGIRCNWGLRSSTYDVLIDGKQSKATTYYLATSASKK